MQIISTHKNTDFDALASMVAATILYPGSIPVIPKAVNPNVRDFLSIHKDVFKMYRTNEIDFAEVESLIVVDINSWNRLDLPDKLREKKGLEIILWDHHSDDGDINPSWKCVDEIGANITLMVRMLKEKKKVLTPIQATLFLAGIYEDTGNLSFLSTKAEDAHAAAFLLEHKADLNIVGKFLRPAYGEKQKNVLFQMLQSAARTRIKGYSISFSKLDINGHISGLSLVVNMYRQILNVDAAFGIFENKDSGKCIIIGRSNVDALDIGVIMRSIGGGGHAGAGSAMLKSVNSDKVEEMIRNLIEGDQRTSVQISDLMSFPVVAVSSDTKIKDVGSILKEKGCTGLPVVDDGRLVGIISRRDFRKIRKKSQEKAPVKAFMSTNVTTIDPEKSPIQAARLMIKHDIGRLPVVENGRIIGIVTRSDAMVYLYDLLPE